MIEEAHPDDAGEILAVINMTNRESYQYVIPEEHFRDPFITREKLLKSFDEMTFFTYKRDGEVLGVAALQVENEQLGKMLRLYVLPEYQGRGIGTALVAHLERKAREVGLRRLKLHVTEKADWALGFYRGLGYDLADRIESPAGAAVVMEKRLP